MITFSHFYEFFILFQDSQNVLCRSSLTLLRFEQKVKENIFSTSICNSTTPPFKPLGAFTPQALVSSGGSEGEWSIWLKSSVWNFMIFFKTLELRGLLFLSLIRRYSYTKILLLCFVISRIELPDY